MENLTFNELPGAVSQLLNDMEEIKLLLRDKNNHRQPEADQLLTIKEAATFLKIRVSTIYGLTHRSEIPVCKKGNRLFFSRKNLLAWIETGRRKTIKEMEIEAVQYLNKKSEKHHEKK